jgi:hypothetical protein
MLWGMRSADPATLRDAIEAAVVRVRAGGADVAIVSTSGRSIVVSGIELLAALDRARAVCSEAQSELDRAARALAASDRAVAALDAEPATSAALDAAVLVRERAASRAIDADARLATARSEEARAATRARSWLELLT